MEEPLIGLGFADNREQVLQMLMKVDTSGDGEIEFDEFLAILKGGEAGGVQISQFFKDMSKGKIGSKDLSFNIIV